jgi:hypothetical protein
MSSLAMSRAEREAFLAETHVAILAVSDPDPRRGPLALPIWYDYAPGGAVRFVTDGGSRKVPLLRSTGRASICAQEESVPYRYVTVEGPIKIGTPDFQRDVRAVAVRYLGDAMGEAYLRATAAQHETAILVSLRPERWLTADFRKFAV